ncbi:MAG: beta-mannosidase [Bacteroidales bacterium]|nr:beta-mannosidase [Bacteroidales bacterium]
MNEIMKRLFLLSVVAICMIACSKPADPTAPVGKAAPEVVSCSMTDGAQGVSVKAGDIELTFDISVRVKDASAITMAGAVLKITGMNTKVKVSYETLEYGKTYTLNVPSSSLASQVDNTPIEKFSVSFTTMPAPSGNGPGEENPPFVPGDPGDYAAELVTENPIPNAKRLYDYMLSIYGEKTLSSAIAKVDWNTSEADWIRKWTGKSPAIHTFDYIHLGSSPCNWIDYSKTDVVEKWFNTGGIIGACWHWNVPAYDGASDNTFTCTADKTDFKVSNIFKEGTWEHRTAQADLEEIAGYLKLLQDKGIPVIWRPLHEAAGNIFTQYASGAWFWWGEEGAEQYKKLWRYMFDFFKAKGLRNLIWVWTSQTTSQNDSDYSFYPGDDYVDIVGKDMYNVSQSSEMVSCFNTVASMVPHKMIALSEHGNVPNMSSQWNAGARWLFFMPWYDYDNDGTSGYAHYHATISWWNSSLASSAVITRDELPDNLYE